MTSIIWNHRVYDQRDFSDFYDFVASFVDDDAFVLVIEDRTFDVTLGHDEWAASAVTTNYDGFEDTINIAHAGTKAQAIESLVEKLSEAIYEEKI